MKDCRNRLFGPERGPASRRDLVAFSSTDAAGFPVYHTNVMMAVGTDVAVVCLESVADPKERRHLLASLRRHQEVRHPAGQVSRLEIRGTECAWWLEATPQSPPYEALSTERCDCC